MKLIIKITKHYDRQHRLNASLSSYSFLFLILFLLQGINLHAQDLEGIKSQKPFTFHGSLSTQLQFYDVQGREANRKPFTWIIQGNPVVSIYGVTLPFSFVFSEQQRDFRQPFNRFGVSPYYKWARIHLGYRNLNWSSYSLAGHSINGVGFELTPGKFRIGLMTGQLLKAVEENQVINGEPLKYQTPAFRRTGTSIKLGYGDAKNFLDLVMLKAKDDPKSISAIPTGSNLTPGENLVMSATSHLTIAKKFFVDAEFAKSIYTPDITLKEQDSLDNPFFNVMSFLINEHARTRVSNALKGAVGYTSPTFDIKLKYERVDPGFKSMGAYYFLTDLRKITVEPTFKLWKKKLVVGGSYGNQIDNLNNEKSARTVRNIGSVLINFMPVQQYNLNINYSNYGLGQKSGIIELDTLTELSQTTKQIGITQNVNFRGENLMHNILATYNYQKLQDANQNTSGYSEYNSNILMANYMLSYTPWNLSGGIGYTRTDFHLVGKETLMSGPTINFSKILLKNKLNIAASYTAYKNKVDKILSSNISTLSVQAGFRYNKHNRLSTRFYLTNSEAVDVNAKSYNEKKIDLSYVYTF